MSSKEWIARNKDKIAQYKKKHYEANKARIIRESAERRRKIRDQIRQIKQSLSCATCGESHPACLDFHHEDPSQKDGTVSSLVSRKGVSIRRVHQEIEKCVVLCANCHRKVHYKEVG